MDYEKIKVIQMKSGLSDAKFGKSIGMTGPGYRYMLLNHTCVVDTLEEICKKYSIPIDYFFSKLKLPSDSKDTLDNNDDCRECLKKDAKIELLEEQLKEKEFKIDALNRELGKSDRHKRTG